MKLRLNGVLLFLVLLGVILLVFPFVSRSAEVDRSKTDQMDELQLKLDKALVELNKVQMDINLDPKLRRAKAVVLAVTREIKAKGFDIQQQPDNTVLVVEKVLPPTTSGPPTK